MPNEHWSTSGQWQISNFIWKMDNGNLRPFRELLTVRKNGTMEITEQTKALDRTYKLDQDKRWIRLLPQQNPERSCLSSLNFPSAPLFPLFWRPTITRISI